VTLLRELRDAEIPLAPFETARTPERQVELFKRGRVTGYGPLGHHVTYDLAWTSRHQFGLAVDMVFFVNGKWTWEEPQKGMWVKYLDIAAKIGLQGLRRNDGSVIEWPHVQHPWPLIKLRNGEYPPGGDASWSDFLNASVFRWGDHTHRIAGVDHPASPPRATVGPERPALDSAVFPQP
jgi:peptidoglycan L-alanyl-D-glutamate endopeptidase CwlK